MELRSAGLSFVTSEVKGSKQTSCRAAVGKTLSNVLLPESYFVSKMGLQEMGYEDGRWIELA
jgi:hypothetical protein